MRVGVFVRGYVTNNAREGCGKYCIGDRRKVLRAALRAVGERFPGEDIETALNRARGFNLPTDPVRSRQWSFLQC